MDYSFDDRCHFAEQYVESPLRSMQRKYSIKSSEQDIYCGSAFMPRVVVS